MQAPRIPTTRASIESATGFSQGYAEKTIARALAISADKEIKERHKVSLCQWCYYVPERIGGAACTTRECGICLTDVNSGNTNVDVLCPDCARKAKLCRHCGGDVDMKFRRSKREGVK